MTITIQEAVYCASLKLGDRRECWFKVGRLYNHRFDRDRKKTDKNIAGRLCVLASKRWATNYSVHERVSTRSYELLTVSFRPHYLPREFSQVTVIPVYISGLDTDTQAAGRVVESYNRAINRSGDQAVFVSGDFNACDITGLLPNLHQNVTCPTRFNKTIDLSFSCLLYTSPSPRDDY